MNVSHFRLSWRRQMQVVVDMALALSAWGSLYTQGYLRTRRKLKAVVEALPLPVRRVLARLAA